MREAVVVRLAKDQRKGQPGQSGKQTDHADHVHVGVRLRGHHQHHRTCDHYKSRSPAQDREELPRVIQRLAEIVGRCDAPVLHGADKVPEHQRGGNHHCRYQEIEDAAFVQAVFIKSELILQPAEEHTESAGTGYIAADFQRFFIHKPYLDSIRCLCINWELYDYIPFYTISQGKRFK